MPPITFALRWQQDQDRVRAARYVHRHLKAAGVTVAAIYAPNEPNIIQIEDYCTAKQLYTRLTTAGLDVRRVHNDTIETPEGVSYPYALAVVYVPESR